MVFYRKQNNKTERDVDIIKLVNDIFYQGISEGASDIHIEPQIDKVIVRYRIDGILRIIFEGDFYIFEHMTSRIKILADLEMTGMPKPQEGYIKFEYDERFVDLRVSVLPTSLGDSIVIRILESNKNFGNYKELGLTEDQEKILDTITRKPHGLLLVTGPNGSGKSTTLLTILNQLNTTEKSLVTLEDPVERKINMVRQTNIDPGIGLTFADGLRYLLRQDPDIIMVGEIRDSETARIAVQAAITGHLVLATIHTNNAAGAIVRLINMGIEPFLLASALKCVTAQRLARLNCHHCKEKYEAPKELLDMLDAPENMVFYKSSGCEKCNNRGMIGRKGIHEIIQITKPIQELILKRPTDEDINNLAIEEGMITLRQAALLKAKDGLISLEEAIRLTEE